MRNKQSRTCCYSFIILVAIAWLVYMVTVNYPGTPTNDTLRQLREGMCGVYTNWKPTLYSWQLGQLERWFPNQGIGGAYILQILGFAVAVAAIAWHYMREHVVYALLVSVLPLFFTVKGMHVTTVGNDEQAAVCYLLFIAAILHVSTMRRGMWRNLLLLAAWLCLGYGLTLRHNAMPAVLALAGWGWWKSGMKSWWRIACVSAGFLVAMLLVNFGVSYYVLKAEPSYPLRSPLTDDIVNLSILEGKWHPVVEKFDNPGLKPPHVQCIYAPESGNWNSPINPYVLYPSVNDRLRDYELLKSAWWEMVSEHPGRYLVTKFFFFHQFLLEGRCIPWLCEALRAEYPHITIHMEEESRNWRAWVNREFIVMSVIPLSCYALLLLCCLRCVRRWIADNSVRMDAMVFIAVAFLYTSSFILLVLSATEQRYYIIRASICCVAAALLFISAWVRPKQQD